MESAGWLSRLRRRKFLLLLVSLLSVAVLHPVVQGRFIGPKTYDVLFCVFLMVAVFAVSQHRRPFLCALALGMPALVMTWVAEGTAGSSPSVHGAALLGRHVAYLVFLGFAAVNVLRYVLQSEKVTNDKLCGAMCVYLLLGMIWAVVYSMVEQVQPGSFSLNTGSQPAAPIDGKTAGDPGRQSVSSQLGYYSFVTLTTLGYGDVTPNSPAARTFSWLEALLGQLYLAVLVARMVGLHIAHGRPPPEPDC